MLFRSVWRMRGDRVFAEHGSALGLAGVDVAHRELEQRLDQGRAHGGCHADHAAVALRFFAARCGAGSAATGHERNAISTLASKLSRDMPSFACIDMPW